LLGPWSIHCVCVCLYIYQMLALGSRSRKPSDSLVFLVVNFMMWEFEFGLWLLWEILTSARWHYSWCWSQIEWWCFIDVILGWPGFKAFKWKISNSYAKVIELVICSLYRHTLMCCWVMPPISCYWKQNVSSWCVLNVACCKSYVALCKYFMRNYTVLVPFSALLHILTQYALCMNTQKITEYCNCFWFIIHNHITNDSLLLCNPCTWYAIIK
jgi:hypothetical protein